MKGRQMKEGGRGGDGGREGKGEKAERRGKKKLETERIARVAGSGAGQRGADGGYLQFFTQNRTTEARRLVAPGV